MHLFILAQSPDFRHRFIRIWLGGSLLGLPARHIHRAPVLGEAQRRLVSDAGVGARDDCNFAWTKIDLLCLVKSEAMTG